MAAVDAHGRIARIEDVDDVAHLRVFSEDVRDEAPLVDLALNRGDPTNDGYEGCRAVHLAWTGAQFVVVSRETGSARAWRVTPPPRNVAHEAWRTEDLALSTSHAIVGNTVACLGDEPGLVTLFDLERFDWCAPLPLPRALAYARIEAATDGVRALEGANVIAQLALPTEAQRRVRARDASFLDVLATRVIGGANPRTVSRMIVDSAALPFVQLADAPHPGVSWLPAYYARMLVAHGRIAEEAGLRAALARLGEIGAASIAIASGWQRAWQPIEGALLLAEQRVRAHARELARVIERGTLPPGVWCVLFTPAPGKSEFGSRLDRAALTPTLARFVDELVPTAPQELARAP